MVGVTLLIAIFASLLVLILRPARAFAIYVIALLIYPTYLVVQIGTLDISAVRIIVAVLLLRCLCDTELKARFKWCRLDSWVSFGAIVSVVIPLISWRMPVLKALENRSGALMDTYFVYLIARFCITDRRDMVVVIKWIGVILIPLALVGIVESVTGWQSYAPLKAYCPWANITGVVEKNIRSGLYRSVGPFSNSIIFGASFAMFLPLVCGLRNEKGYWRKLAYLLTGLTIAGTLSSMSSGPVMMVIIIIGCLILEHFKYLVKPIIISAIFSCFIVDIMSNRNFYDVFVTYINPIGGSGWHRSRLIHLAIDHFGEWWLVGYGGRDPGWGASLGMTWTDNTNHYIMAGVKFGLLGVIAVCGILTVSIMTLIRLYNASEDPTLQSWYWALGSLIVMLAIAFNAILFSGQASTIFYCILGIIGSLDNMRASCRIHQTLSIR